MRGSVGILVGMDIRAYALLNSRLRVAITWTVLWYNQAGIFVSA